MYVADDVCYAGTLENDIKVSAVKPLTGRMMLVTFSSGETRLFDTTLLDGEAFKALEDEEIFSKPAIFHGIITWKDGEIDVSPEKVYQESFAYDSKAI